MLQVRWCAIAACVGHAGDLLQCYSQAGDYIAIGEDDAGDLLQCFG